MNFKALFIAALAVLSTGCDPCADPANSELEICKPEDPNAPKDFKFSMENDNPWQITVSLYYTNQYGTVSMPSSSGKLDGNNYSSANIYGLIRAPKSENGTLTIQYTDALGGRGSFALKLDEIDGKALSFDFDLAKGGDVVRYGMKAYFRSGIDWAKVTVNAPTKR